MPCIRFIIGTEINFIWKQNKNSILIFCFPVYYYVFFLFGFICKPGISVIKLIYKEINIQTKFKGLIISSDSQEWGEKDTLYTVDECRLKQPISNITCHYLSKLKWN